MTYARKGSLNCAYPQKKTKKFCYLEKTSYLCSRKHRGVEQLVARQAHNLEVTRSSRVSATEVQKVLDNKAFLDICVLGPDKNRTCHVCVVWLSE